MKYCIGITGASGGVLAQSVLRSMSRLDAEINIIATQNGEKVFEFETGTSLREYVLQLTADSPRMILHDNDNMFASVASGSYGLDGMVIVPCSMAAVGKIVHTTGDSLLCRAADVCLKERIKLVVVPRETPLHTGHLKNLYELSALGAVILPPMPMFYAKPQSVDDVVSGITGRILKSLGVENELYLKWGEEW